MTLCSHPSLPSAGHFLSEQCVPVILGHFLATAELAVAGIVVELLQPAGAGVGLRGRRLVCAHPALDHAGRAGHAPCAMGCWLVMRNALGPIVTNQRLDMVLPGRRAGRGR